MKKVVASGALLLALLAAALLAVPRPGLLPRQGSSRAFLDRDGKLLRLTLAPDERYRLPVPLEGIAPEMRAATLLYEDRRFYRHPGVDPLALARACWESYVTRKRKVGASTITMQVARLRWELDTRRPAGKLIQILRALQLERHYTKDEILAAYLNLAPYGRNVEGIEAASRIYFDKPASRLSLPEALSLCVVPQNPVGRNPTTAEGFAALKAARDPLFERWCEAHPAAVRLKSFFDLPLRVRAPEALPFAAPHLVTGLDQALPADQKGHIRTTIDGALQQMAEARLSAHIARHRPLGIANGAMAVLNHRTMEIEALVGSAGFHDAAIKGQVNGCMALRSPGSALKPFVYALAMDQGLIHPLTMVKDAPRRFAGFTPENFDQAFLGPVSARDALIASRNLPAADLLARLRKPGLYGLLHAAGVRDLKPEGFYGLALALGGVEVSLLDLLRLYAMLPNGGKLLPLRMLADAPAEARDPPAPLSPEACFLVLDILEGNPPPTGTLLPGQARAGMKVAWKTGTSHGFRDAWAVGVAGPYVVAVWIGNFDGAGNRAFVGRRAAGPLLFEIFRSLGGGEGWQGTDRLDPGGLNLKRVTVCAATGDLPGRWTPRTTETWFIPGVSPIRVSDIHRAVPVDRESGLRACRHEPGRTELQVYAFWPSDLARIFRQAGIAFEAPPPLEADCGLDAAGPQGAPPVIRSPVPHLEYRLRSEALEREQIPLSAVADGDVRRLFWFVDDAYVGASPAGEPFFWSPACGDFVVRVVDDHGRAAQRALRVLMAPDRGNG